MNKSKGDPKKTMSRLFYYISAKNRVQVVVVMSCIMITAFSTVSGTMFIRVLIDDYITPMIQSGSTDFTPLFIAIRKLVLIYACGVVAAYIYNRTMAVLGQLVQKNIRNDLFSHMQALPVKYFDTHAYGDIMSRFTNDIDTLRQMISQSLPQAFSFFVTLIFAFCSMLYTSLMLSGIVLLLTLVVFFVMKKITGNSRKYFIRQQQAIGAVNGFAEEMMTGQKVIKVFSHEEQSKQAFDVFNERLRLDAERANTFANILMPVLFNIGNLQYVILAIAGGFFALHGTGGMTLGAIASFVQLSKSYSAQVNQVSQQFNSVIMALAGAERIFELLDEEVEEDCGCVSLVNMKKAGSKLLESNDQTGHWAWKYPHQDGTVTDTKLSGEIRLDGVDFGYNEGEMVLHDIRIFAKSGQKIAFVGATGAGKTTITNLLNRFYDIQDGMIQYDGININKIKKRDLRRSLGVVLQDTHLFTASIMENIRYGRLEASNQEVIAAAKLANAHSFITRLPAGYNTVLKDAGTGLSQGQRQLISIARAAVANPPVMVLDEATASIDTRTESLVQSGMDSLMQGRTVLVIAHRLATIQNADVIMVMEAGRIIERGSHDDLIRKKGRYYQLYMGDFELALG